jgi:hypothetical protein
MIFSKKMEYFTCLIAFVSLVIFLAAGVSIYVGKNKDEGILTNTTLDLDFRNFTNTKFENVMIGEKIYRAVLLEEYFYETTKSECAKKNGVLPWNRAVIMSGKPQSIWIDVTNNSNLEDANLREIFEEVPKLFLLNFNGNPV